MSILVFENTTKPKGGTAKNIIRPDATGYYHVISGAFNSHNASGAFYPFTEEVKKLFMTSSDLMERVSKGRLYGEWGHPVMEPGMTTREFLLKLLIIHDAHMSHHIKKVEVEDGATNHDGSPCALVHLWVKPFGPHADIIQTMLENGEQDGCFSLRSICVDKNDPATGKLIKVVAKIITWDGVGEPGKEVASKRYSPAVESRHEFTRQDVIDALHMCDNQGAGLESVKADVLSLAEEFNLPRNIIKAVENSRTDRVRPKYLSL